VPPRAHLEVGGAEAAAHVLVVEDGDLKGQVLLQVLDDHHLAGLAAVRIA
jgi:hypothetical protein